MLPAPIHQVLDTQKRIAARLEDAAKLERPWNLRRRREEPEHLHGVTRQPAGQDRQPEALARSGAHVGEYLRQGQRCFDREADVAEERGVHGVQAGEGGDYEFERREYYKEVEQELPVSVGSHRVSKQPCVDVSVLGTYLTYGFGDRHCQKL